MTTPTKSQQHAIKEFKKFLDNPKDKYFHLRGAAGRGKTWLYAKFLYSLTPTPNTLLTSTTNQGVLSFYTLFSNSFDKKILTVHSAVGLRPSNKKCTYYSNLLKKDVYYEVNLNIYKTTTLVVIDEAYRIDSVLFDFLTITYPNAKFLFIYDPYQTKPINSDGWTIDSLKDSVHVELTEPTRFSLESDLNEFVDNFHLAVKFNETNYKDLLPSKNSSTISNITKHALRSIVDSYTNTDIDETETLILSGTRKQADSIHRYIIQQRINSKIDILRIADYVNIEYSIGNENHYPVEIEFIKKHGVFGSTLYSSTPYTSNNLSIQLKERLHPILNKMGMVNKIPLLQTSLEYRFCFVYLRVGHQGKPLLRNELITLWEYHKITGNSIVILNLNIVKTIHSAQGITTQNAYLLTDSIESWKSLDDILRLYYTGSSRASKHLYLVNS